MPLSRPISSALTGHSPAIVAVVWLLQDRPQEQGVKNSAAASAEEPGAGGQTPASLPLRGTISSTIYSFSKGPAGLSPVTHSVTTCSHTFMAFPPFPVHPMLPRIASQRN